MKTLGRTADGMDVVDIFDWYDRHGLSLDDCMELCREHGLVPAWPTFIERAAAAKWNVFRLLRTLSTVILEHYGEDYTAEWRGRVIQYFRAQSGLEQGHDTAG